MKTNGRARVSRRHGNVIAQNFRDNPRRLPMQDENALAAEIGGDRVRSMTPNHVNERIQREMEGELAHLKGRPKEEVQRRMFELEREWNVDQALMTNLAVLGVAGVLAGAFHKRSWLVAPAIQLGFLLMHASQGWCPPTGIFRRL